MHKLFAAVAASFAIAATCGTAQAQISDDVVKISVLTDMSSLYADATGKGSLAAVKMAGEGYGGKGKGKPGGGGGAPPQKKPGGGGSLAPHLDENEKGGADPRVAPSP